MLTEPREKSLQPPPRKLSLGHSVGGAEKLIDVLAFQPYLSCAWGPTEALDIKIHLRALENIDRFRGQLK